MCFMECLSKNKGNPERNQFRNFLPFFFSYILDLGLEVGMTKKKQKKTRSRWWMIQPFEQNKQKRKESKERGGKKYQ